MDRPTLPYRTPRPLLFKGGVPLAHGVVRGAAPPLNPRLFVGRFFFFFVEKKKEAPLQPQKKEKCGLGAYAPKNPAQECTPYRMYGDLRVRFSHRLKRAAVEPPLS